MPDDKDVSQDDLEAQEAELLPEREAMSVISPLGDRPEIYLPPDGLPPPDEPLPE
jgi:hypothetical protein